MSSAGHYADLSSLGDKDLGISSFDTPKLPGVDEPAPSWENFSELQTIELVVPSNPKAVDFVRAYHNQVNAEAERAQADVLSAELNAANAERIANAARAKATRLRAQAQDLKSQIEQLSPTPKFPAANFSAAE